MNTIIAGRFDEQGCAERALTMPGQPALVSGAG